MSPTTAMMSWAEYVRLVIGDDKQIDVARKTQIHQTTISRWLDENSTSARSSQAVRRFAHVYQRSVLECFVFAGFLTTEEAGLQDVDLSSPAPSARDLLKGIDAADLMRELQDRLTS